MIPFDYAQLLRLAAPEVILALAALVVLFVDLGWMRDVERTNRRLVAAAGTLLGCFAAGFWALRLAADGVAPAGMLVADPVTALVQCVLVALTAFTALVSVEFDFTEHIGEYFALLLLTAIGMLFLVAAENLLMIFAALELTSLPLYVLTALDRRRPQSAEAGLKYFLFGSVASAFLLFGFSFLYGVSGSLELRGIAAAAGSNLDSLLLGALVMVVMGFGFKIAAVPFHLWAPLTYQGAPTPCAAFIASGSKVAAFYLLTKLLMLGFAGAGGSAGGQGFAAGWIPLLAALAAASMILGNLAAVTQNSVKRLLAYSAVAHAGYTLVGAAADSVPGLAAVIYYSATYAVAVLGAFAVTGLVESQTGDAKLADFAGLSRRAPLMALCLMVFLLSLAGIPPLAGFFGKFYLFASALRAEPGLGLLWLVILALAMSAVSLYYYLQVLKQAYVVRPTNEPASLRPSFPYQLAVVALALLTILLGCAPNLLVGPLLNALSAAGF